MNEKLVKIKLIKIVDDKNILPNSRVLAPQTVGMKPHCNRFELDQCLPHDSADFQLI